MSALMAALDYVQMSPWTRLDSAAHNGKPPPVGADGGLLLNQAARTVWQKMEQGPSIFSHRAIRGASGAVPMRQNDDARPERSLTPSGWHDDARTRDAGHDDMQAEQYRHFVSEIGWRIKRPVFGAEMEFELVRTIVEFPFIANDRCIGFADLGLQFQADDNGYWWWFIELKPVIYSVGAVIRQCRATIIQANRAGFSRKEHRGFSDFEVIPAVYRHDPKAALLHELEPSTVVLSADDQP